MIRLSMRRKQAALPDTLEELVALAAAGRRDAREQLLHSYLPFVERVASTTCGRAIARTDDEFQIALLALDEAISSYVTERGAFIRFAETVMRRRLIDSFRANQRRRELPFTAFDETDEEGNVQNSVEVATALHAHQHQEEAAIRADEIKRYSDELELYGIHFMDLTENSPKHADAREHALEAARVVAFDETLRAYFLKTKSLPLKQLAPQVAVSRKTLERQRQYIIAAIVLLLGDYELLHSFVMGGERR
ncbi:MAG: RNA polymerase sigma-I factor [Acidibacillus sp.]|uniref:RNA polymerase sigma factor SigI n=1 Tax=Sulfoacidibacillus ferrooxidans TaxID=2005001 RepID=A0A9X1V6C6_9BACL|nr:RNA polymerase sigma factor SigI [Sulfoacidibacillus ferrooxidans]MCY0892401.1 RNA polymerase sigma-I factor [Acidibacillus sp.]